MITALLTILYVVVCVFLIVVVLLQTGKRADLAGAFGGGGSQTAFGTRGAATLLAKATTGAAVAFMVLALVLAIRSSGRETGESVLEQVPEVEGPAVIDEGFIPEGAPESDSAPFPVDPPAEEDAGADIPPTEPPAGDADGGEAP